MNMNAFVRPYNTSGLINKSYPHLLAALKLPECADFLEFIGIIGLWLAGWHGTADGNGLKPLNYLILMKDWRRGPGSNRRIKVLQTYS